MTSIKVFECDRNLRNSLRCATLLQLYFIFADYRASNMGLILDMDTEISNTATNHLKHELLSKRYTKIQLHPHLRLHDEDKSVWGNNCCF
jgi:hypothetical protein